MASRKKNLSAATKALVKRTLELMKPTEQMKVSEWAQKYRVLSSESSSLAGRWRNDKTPYLVEIMDSVHDERVKETVIMASSQVGKSECLNNILGYFVDIDPCPMLFLQPTIQLAEDYSKDRIAPMIRDCKRLREKIPEGRGGDLSNTLLHKSYPGGHFTLAGSNSPASLASRPIRVLLIDEVDRMTVTSEGDPVALAEKRTITFYNRVIIKVSTPTVKNLSRIERDFLRSDQRYFFVPCPKCAHEQRLIWGQVSWSKDENGKGLPQTAHYSCEKCNCEIRDWARYEMIRKGRWKATAAFSGVAGYHINELYSSWRKLEEIVKDFLDKRDAIDTLRVWINTTLGEPFEIKAKSLSWEALSNKKELYVSGSLPKGVLLLTAGIDVQEERLHIEIVGWGRLMESWSIAYLVFHGDTTGQKVWQDLDDVICSLWNNANGFEIGISKVAIDANFNTPFVHSWVRQYPLSQVFPVYGRDGQQAIVGQPDRHDIANNQKMRTGLKSYPVGVSVIKQELYGFLSQTVQYNGVSKPIGLCHFPMDYTDDYFRQLAAEQLVKDIKRGVVKYRWIKRQERNEALDCRVYARAAACLFGIDRFTEESFIRLENDFAPAIRKRVLQEAAGQIKETDQESIWES